MGSHSVKLATHEPHIWAAHAGRTPDFSETQAALSMRPSHAARVSLALPATRHRRTRPALTPAR